MGSGMMGSNPNQYPQQTQNYGPGMMGNGVMGQGIMTGRGMMGGQGGDGYGHCFGAQWNDTVTSNYARVIIADDAFYPKTLTVKAGTTVTWINMDFDTHNVESGTSAKATDLFKSTTFGHMESFSYTFTELGEYVYHCDLHPGMEGTIIVVK